MMITDVGRRLYINFKKHNPARCTKHYIQVNCSKPDWLCDCFHEKSEIFLENEMLYPSDTVIKCSCVQS